MGPLRTVIVEDEPLALHRLELALEGEEVSIVGSAGEGRRGLDMIRRLKPDLVFLDVKTPGLTGIEVAHELANDDQQPAVVFVTAFAHFAVEAFDLAAVDYVLKPVEFDRVHAAVDRARRRLEQARAEKRAEELQGVLNAVRREAAESADPAGVLRSVWVPTARGRVKVMLESVEWFEAERDYVRIHADGRAHLLRSTLHGFFERVDQDLFVRIHRSAVVNLKAVKALHRRVTGQVVVELDSGVELPVGRAHVNPLKARLGLEGRGVKID